jgi:hypothetical protein
MRICRQSWLWMIQQGSDHDCHSSRKPSRLIRHGTPEIAANIWYDDLPERGLNAFLVGASCGRPSIGDCRIRSGEVGVEGDCANSRIQGLFVGAKLGWWEAWNGMNRKEMVEGKKDSGGGEGRGGGCCGVFCQKRELPGLNRFRAIWMII